MKSLKQATEISQDVYDAVSWAVDNAVTSAVNWATSTAVYGAVSGFPRTHQTWLYLTNPLAVSQSLNRRSPFTSGS